MAMMASTSFTAGRFTSEKKEKLKTGSIRRLIMIVVYVWMLRRCIWSCTSRTEVASKLDRVGCWASLGSQCTYWYLWSHIYLLLGREYTFQVTPLILCAKWSSDSLSRTQLPHHTKPRTIPQTNSQFERYSSRTVTHPVMPCACVLASWHCRLRDLGVEMVLGGVYMRE
jgi:hypothetical protein